MTLAMHLGMKNLFAMAALIIRFQLLISIQCKINGYVRVIRIRAHQTVRKINKTRPALCNDPSFISTFTKTHRKRTSFIHSNTIRKLLHALPIKTNHPFSLHASQKNHQLHSKYTTQTPRITYSCCQVTEAREGERSSNFNLNIPSSDKR